MKEGISLIIPTLNCKENLDILLDSINNQSLLANEIIIVDSSDNRLIENLVNKKISNIPIIYIKTSQKYPGEKRNIGAQRSSYEWLAFLDVGTVPRDHWLKTNLTIATEYGYYAVFGKTKYRALNEFQKLLRAATFGNIGHETTPGSLVRNDYFQKSGGFIEGIRAGDDQEWRMQIRDVSKKYFTPTETTLDYSILPNNLLDMQKKYFIYYLHSAKVRAQKKIRDLYLSVFLIFLMIIVTKWNYIIGGWDTNPLFIPNIQKIFTLSMVLILLIFIIFDGLFTQRGSLNLLNWTAKVLLFFLISLSVYRWNTEVIDWVEDSIFFIPHITKIYIVMLLLCSFFYRGIFTPLRLGIAPSFIFPINWIKVGLIGLSFDLLKTPGIMLGIILAPFQKKLSKL